MTRAEEKAKLRTSIRALERELPAAYRRSSDQTIARRLLALPEYQEADTVFCFVSTPREIDTRPMLEAALSAGKTLCVPLCTGPGVMELRRVASLTDDLIPGKYGIWEPRADCPAVPPDGVDLAVIPCLTCNHLGYRLGKGGGYYDRFLAVYRGAAVLLCREQLIREEIPREAHDLPIPWVLTETGLFEDGTPARPE